MCSEDISRRGCRDDIDRNHLKQLNTEYLPNGQFVKSFRKNEPDNIVLLKNQLARLWKFGLHC